MRLLVKSRLPGTTIRSADCLRITLPALGAVRTTWDELACELHLTGDAEETQGSRVAVELEVTSGAVLLQPARCDEGLELTAPAVGARSGDGRVRRNLPALSGANSIFLVNGNDDGPTDVALYGVTLEKAASDDAAIEVPLVPDPRKYVTARSGVTAPGYWTDWSGVATKAAFSGPFVPAQTIDVERYESPRFPDEGRDAIFWSALVNAIRAAENTVVIAEIGAGYGRWLARGGVAARRMGKRAMLVGVEPEPAHFSYMQEHLRDNGVEENACRLLRAVASGDTSGAWFPIGPYRGRSEGEFYGQSVIAETDVATYDSGALERVPSVTLAQICEGLPPIDFLYVDILGAQVDFLSCDPALLRERVRTVVLPTINSCRAERELRRLLCNLGWKSDYDLPPGARVRIRGAQKAFTLPSGIQVWSNPKPHRRCAVRRPR
jgi:FkbM family methyltransferase